jgi:hypothetical protein
LGGHPKEGNKKNRRKENHRNPPERGGLRRKSRRRTISRSYALEVIGIITYSYTKMPLKIFLDRII